MKNPSSFLTNPTTPPGRANGQAINDPGGDTGSGIDEEIYNDPVYGHIAVIESYKDGGISDSDETTTASDVRDALEEITDRRVTDSGTPANSIDEWDSGTTYSAVELVTWKGFQFVAYNTTGNLNKNPLLFPDFWMLIPKPDDLLDKFFSGQVCSGGLSDIADRAGGNFAQNIEYGHYRLGGNGDDFYEFFRVTLDGTVVTGDTTLEDDIFKEGTADEYWNIDIVAPDVVGTRTLLDMGDYIPTPQSSSGDGDTVGDLIEDQFQGHRFYVLNVAAATSLNRYGHKTGEASGIRVATGSPTTTTEAAYTHDTPVDDDKGNGTPRTGTTTHGKRFTEGASYIIVMNVL